MTRVRRWTVAVVIAVGVGSGAGGCEGCLPAFPSGQVTCDPDGVGCPEGFQCLDPHHSGLSTCVRVACGDGTINGPAERCDDANANDDDLCDARLPQQIPSPDAAAGDDSGATDVLGSSQCRAAHFCASAVRGLGIDGGPDDQVNLGRPLLVTSDPFGVVYASSGATNFIHRIDREVVGSTSGEPQERLRITRFAGNGTTVNVAAPGADLLPDQISTPLVASIAADAVGNVILADVQANVIRRIEASSGKVTRIAGNGQTGRSRTDVAATETPLGRPIAVAVNADGVVHFLEDTKLQEDTESLEGTTLGRYVVRRIVPSTAQIEVPRIVRTGAIDGVTVSEDLDDSGLLGISFDGRDHLWLVTGNCPSLFPVGREWPPQAPKYPCFDGEERVPGGEVIDVDLSTGEATPYSLRSCGPVLDDLFPAEDPESVILQNQARLVVNADGTQVYFPRGNRIYRFEPRTNRCEPIDVIDELTACAQSVDPSVVQSNPLFSTGFFDLTLVPLSSREDGLRSYRLLATDGAAGVIRGVDITERAASPAIDEEATPAETVIDTKVAPSIGTCFAGDEGALIADLLLNFTGETDGRITLSETLECCTPGIDSTCVLPAIDDFSRYAILLPLPASHLVARVDCVRSVEVLAGGGRAGFDGDEPRPAANALLDNPVAAAESLDGTVYIADANNRRVRRIRTYNDSDGPPGTCTAGTPCLETLLPPCAANSAPTAPCVFRPLGLAVDASGQLLVSDAGPSLDEGRILRVDVSAAEPAVNVLLDGLREPTALLFMRYDFIPDVLAASGNAAACAPAPGSSLTASACGLVLFTERSAHRVRVRTLAPLPSFDLVIGGERLTVAEPAPGDVDDDEGQVNQGRFRFPRGLMIDAPTEIASVSDPGTSISDVRLLVVDGIDRLRRIVIPIAAFTDLRVLADGLVPTRVTTASALRPTPPEQPTRGFLGRDDSADRSGVLRSPSDIEVLPDGRQLLLDRLTGRLRLADPQAGTLVTWSGMVDGVDPGTEPVGVLEAAPLSEPRGLARDGDVLYAADTGSGRIRRFFLTPPEDPERWTTDILPIAGDGEHFLVAPADVSVDPETHELYVADRARHVVYRVTPATAAGAAAALTVVAGRAGRRGFGGDADPSSDAIAAFDDDRVETYAERAARLDSVCTPTEPKATDALLNAPEGVLFFRDQRNERWLFVADTGNHRVRRVDLDGGGAITTVLGDGSRASGGAGAASTVPVDAPQGLAVDRSGNLFVTSRNAVRFIGADTFSSLCSTSRAGTGVVDAADDAATIYGTGTGFPDSVTRCLVDVAVDPSAPPGGAIAYGVDSCIGMVVRLKRSFDTCPVQ